MTVPRKIREAAENRSVHETTKIPQLHHDPPTQLQRVCSATKISEAATEVTDTVLLVAQKDINLQYVSRAVYDMQPITNEKR